MVVADLGGISPEDQPNPNVMYELGIRHAFGLPVVILAWEDQRLPFDVNNQRAILSKRDFLDIEPTRLKLVRFIEAANEGRFYNPMDAVGRVAMIAKSSAALGEDSLLGALAEEIRELRGVVINRESRKPKVRKSDMSAKRILSKQMRSALWQHAQEIGFDASTWARYLSVPILEPVRDEAATWDIDGWKKHFDAHASLILEAKAARDVAKNASSDLPEEFVSLIADMLPPQPWPTGIHREIAEKLEVSSRRVTSAIELLIGRGVFKPQVDGVVVKQPEVKRIAEGE
jgi:hypothetical protein